jgi:hypothetical protein
MAHIFISYSKRNIDFARHLRTGLQKAGFSVWMDEAQLIASERWWPTIEQSINGCGAFIIIMSPESKESDWVEREILYAERLRKPIFPVLLSGEPWPRLANIQFAEMQAGTASHLPSDLLTGLQRATANVAPASVVAQPVSRPQPRRRSPVRRRLLIGSSLLLVLVAAAVVLNGLNQGEKGTAQLTLTAHVQSSATAAAEQAVTQIAFAGTQQENYLRNLATQTANVPGGGGCWWFTLDPEVAKHLPSPCPNQGPVFVAAVRQDFENGFMLWYASTPQYILFPTEFTDQPQIFVLNGGYRFDLYDDHWMEGETSFDPTIIPPDGRYQPVDRLGKVWREQPGVRSKLGWAVAPEQAVGGRYQLPPGEMCNCVHSYMADGQGNVLDMLQGVTVGSPRRAGGWSVVGTYPFQMEG